MNEVIIVGDCAFDAKYLLSGNVITKMCNYFQCNYIIIILLILCTQSLALQLRTGTEGPYGADVQQLVAHIYYMTSDIVRIQIIDPNNNRWQGESRLYNTT